MMYLQDYFFTAFLHDCGGKIVSNGGILLSLAVAGLVGSASHCAGMCGPFVLSQIASRLESLPVEKMQEWHRVTGALLLPYHFGRACSYALLGGLAAMMVGIVSNPLYLHLISSLCLIFAALLMIATGWNGTRSVWHLLPKLNYEMSRIFGSSLRLFFARPTGWNGFVLGSLLGFLPCGLVYAALMVVAGTADTFIAMAGMLAFAAGTMPILVLIGILGQITGQRWRHKMLHYAPWLMTANAAMLLIVAWRQLV